MRMYGWWMRPPVSHYTFKYTPYNIPRLHWYDIQLVPLVMGIVFGIVIGLLR